MSRFPNRPSSLVLALAAALPALARAEEAPASAPTASAASTPAQTVLVQAPPWPAAPARAAGTSDTASLLDRLPGMTVQSAGGVSGLPVLHGLADDRIKIRVDGAEATAACGNHMNAPLSYIDPTQVRGTRVVAGVSPVSAGGDNIAGVIEVSSIQPVFAKADGVLLATGGASFTRRSVDAGHATAIDATVATRDFSATWAGSDTSAASYRDGRGDRVGDTLFRSTNQSITLGARGRDQLVVLKVGTQDIPYQGFVNQYMDMTGNHAEHANLSWDARFEWGWLHARGFWQNAEHRMGFFSAERPGRMPMGTHGRDASASLQADLPVAGGTLKLGEELHRYRLEDAWPAVSGSMMMGPDTFLSIHDGLRDRVGAYAEWEGGVGAGWTADAGLRLEDVHTGAGPVHGYGCGMMCAADDAAAAAFDASERNRHDRNVDATLALGRELGAQATLELAAAQKTRSPNLYERYAWGRSPMAMSMIGWAGDGNGYVGDLALKPEVARTLALAADFHDERQSRWALRVAPFYTAVQDAIDVDVIGSFQPGMGGGPTRALLRFANHDARLWGVDVSWKAVLLSGAAAGDLDVSGKFDWTRGRRDDGGDLYHVMPPNATLALSHARQGVTSDIELQWVTAKSHVDARRLEPATPGYALLNLGTAWQVPGGPRLRAQVRNVLDRRYALPLGGVDVAALRTDPMDAMAPVPGQGRSFDLGADWRF